MAQRMIFLMALLLIGLAAACGGDDGPSETFIPSPGNSELVVGENRVAIAIKNDKDEPLLATEGTTVHLQFKDAGGELIGTPEEATFVEAIPGTSGFWIVNHTFESAGEAPAVLTVTKGDVTEDIDVRFVVTEAGTAPTIGADAPGTDNPTLASNPNRKQITTDTNPNDAFYQMTVNQALQAGKPFLTIFATPAFCQSSLCGPVLENVKAVQPEFADTVNFIHIEPFVLDENGGLANGQLVASPSANDWSLKTEPWIFIVGSDGKIASRFEGSASPDELREALQAVV